MSNSWLIALSLVISLPSYAKPSLCYERLMKKSTARSVTPKQIEQAEFWLRSNGADEGFPQGWKISHQFLGFLQYNGKDSTAMNEKDFQEWAARYTLSKWDRWNNTNAEQRNQALTLEMMKISPKNASSLPVWNGTG